MLTARTAMEEMRRSSDMTDTELSAAIGRSRTYISSTFRHHSEPKVSTLARIANACGYRLMLESFDGSFRDETVGSVVR